MTQDLGWDSNSGFNPLTMHLGYETHLRIILKNLRFFNLRRSLAHEGVLRVVRRSHGKYSHRHKESNRRPFAFAYKVLKCFLVSVNTTPQRTLAPSLSCAVGIACHTIRTGIFSLEPSIRVYNIPRGKKSAMLHHLLPTANPPCRRLGLSRFGHVNR